MKKRSLFNCILACTLILSLVMTMFVFGPITTNAASDGVDVWSGNAATSFAGGDGTAANPFLIENADQLYKMVEQYHTYEASNGKYFKITKDIYIHNVTNGKSIADVKNKINWLYSYGDSIATASKANSFNGTLDGNGHTIYGLYVNEIKNSGLFPAISSYAVIKNLGFENLYIKEGRKLTPKVSTLINMLDFNPHTEDLYQFYWYEDCTLMIPQGEWKFPFVDWSYIFNKDGIIEELGTQKYYGWKIDYKMYVYDEKKILENLNKVCEGE